MPGAPDLEYILWQHLSSLPYFRGMLRAVEHSFYTELDLPQSILDLGAGDGHFASLLFSNPDEIDPSTAVSPQTSASRSTIAPRRSRFQRDNHTYTQFDVSTSTTPPHHKKFPLTYFIGLDPWWQPLQEARTRNTYQLLTQANGAQMPFPDASFATVISNSVLEHIPDIDPVLQEVQRVLQPGGRFVFCVPNHRFLTDLWGQTILKKLGLHKLAATYNRFFNRIARHHHLDPYEIWQKRLESAGLVVENYWHYFPVQAMHILERGHLFGLPNLLWKKLFGCWVLFPHRANPFIPHRRLLKFMPAHFFHAKDSVNARIDNVASRTNSVTARNDRAASCKEPVSALNDCVASPDSVVTARNDRAASCKELASVESIPDGTCTFYIARRSS